METLISIIFILILSFIVYSKHFNFGYIIDDMNYIAHKKQTSKDYQTFKLCWNFKELIVRIKYNFYGAGTFSINNSKTDHIFTTILYTLLCILIYLSFGKNNVSFCASILYLLNPANNQISLWANGKRYLINIIIMLCMILAGPFGLALYPITALFQVNAILIPLVYGWVGLLALPVFWLISGKEIQAKIAGRLKDIHNEQMKTFNLKKLIPITKIYGDYWLKMIFPGRTQMIYSNLFYWGMTEKGNKDAYSFNAHFWSGFLFVCASIFGMFYFKGQNFWFWSVMVLSVLQWSGFISVTQVFADRYISLSNVFMMYFVSLLVNTLLPSVAVPILVALAVYYILNLQITMTMYKDIWAFYDYHIQWDPWNPKCREFKCTRILAERKDPLAAWEVIKEGLRLNPMDMKMNLMAAHCNELLGDKRMVIFYLKNARMNAYIGQIKLIDNYQKTVFGIDLAEEMKKIESREHNYTSKQRADIKAVHDALLV